VNARDFFMTVTMKGKMQVNETYNETTGFRGKYFLVLPKQIEVSTFKMFKGDEE